MNNFFAIRYGTEILQHTGEHLILVTIAMSIAIAVGIPLGIMMTRYPKMTNPIMIVANAIQTIPSLALFGFLITVPFVGGIGKTPAIIALILYALLPIISNTYTGMKQVNVGVKEAGKSLGMTDGQILMLIEIPLALGVIVAGVRVSTVICVGVATIAAAIGGGGLGVFIFRGISTVDNQLILAGAIPSAIIALLADWGIGCLEKALTQRYQKSRKFSKLLFIFLSVLGLLVLISLGIMGYQKGDIIIGSKNFTEQIILGEMLAQQIENNSNLKVDRQFNLGGTFICHEAVKRQQIDGYIEYTGTAFTAILKEKPINNPQLIYEKVKQVYKDKFQLEVMPSLGFENTYAILIRGEDAKKYNLKTISEAAKYTPKWQAGFGHEFLAREDGYTGLSKTYNLKFASQPQAMELGLMYSALANKNVDLVAGNSTDGLISVLNLFMLKDDKKYFPPYEAVPIFNQKTLNKYPQIQNIIEKLGGQISDKEMQQLNYLVDEKKQSVTTVVKDLLSHKYLINNKE